MASATVTAATVLLVAVSVVAAQRQTVRVISPAADGSASPAAGRTPSATAIDAATLRVASAQLEAYVAAEAARNQTAAENAREPWSEPLHTAPTQDGERLVAVAAFSYDPRGDLLQVLAYANRRWQQIEALGIPDPERCPECSPYHWLPEFAGPTISVADVTGDGRPDFLVPLNGGDNTPGAVVSEDGAGRAGWRYVPFTGPFPTSNVVGRDPRFLGRVLTSAFNDCKPTCAAGKTSTITWTYDRSTGTFRAPSPPGSTAPPGSAANDG
jgi:hypothetical protein